MNGSQSYTPLSSEVGEHGHLKNSLQRYHLFISSMQKESGESSYDLSILRDLSALPEDEYPSLTDKISRLHVMYKDGENMALATLRTLLRQEGFKAGIEAIWHNITDLRDASTRYSRLEAWRLAASRWSNNYTYPSQEELQSPILSQVWELSPPTQYVEERHKYIAGFWSGPYPPQ